MLVGYLRVVVVVVSEKEVVAEGEIVLLRSRIQLGRVVWVNDGSLARELIRYDIPANQKVIVSARLLVWSPLAESVAGSARPGLTGESMARRSGGGTDM